jgi:nicotinic acid mononucleotide adenylyltransferase
MSDAKRARDHYRWADRYNKEGLLEKAAAHMKRAMYYGRTSFGTPFDHAWPCQIKKELCVWALNPDGIPVLFPAKPHQVDVIDKLLASEKMICTDRQFQIQVFPTTDPLIKHHTTREACLSALRFDKNANTRQTRFHSSMYIAPKGGVDVAHHEYEDAVRIGNECIELGFPACLYTQHEDEDSSIRLVEDWRPGRLKIFVFDQPPVDDENGPKSQSTSHPKQQSRWHDAKQYQKYAYFKFMRDTRCGSMYAEVPFKNAVSTKKAHMIPPEFFDDSRPRNEKAIDFTIFRSGPDGCVYLRRSDKSILRMSDCSVLQSIADSAYRAFAARMTDSLDSTVDENPFTKRCPICHEEKEAKEINGLSPCGTMGCAACRAAIKQGTECPCGNLTGHKTQTPASVSTSSAGASASASSMWPMSKMRERVGVSNVGRPRAVLLTTGGMNPVHRGHVSMLNQAASRLERAGYDVVGAWLSPSHDLYVRPKADKLQTVWLSAPLRVELAEMMVADDPLVAISSWESSTKMFSHPYWIDYPVVCEKLKMELRKELGHLNLGELKVFYVCGTDHAAKCRLYDGLEGHGVVVVPRHGETPSAENARDSVYVAAPAKESGISGISSTALRAALASKDDSLLRTMLSADAVDLLLRPTQEQSATFPADFVRLAAMTSKASTSSASTTSASTHTKQQNVGVATVAPSVMDSMWLSYKGEGELWDVAFGYTFDKKTLEIKTVRGGGNERTAKVMVTRCGADASALPKPGPTDSLKAHGISVEKCDIASKMQEPSQKRRVFVLPSQLNAAEYPNETTDTGIVEFLWSYITDRTGGPAAQLAGDPGVAQFIIDNACNANRPDRGINNVRLMGTIKGVALKNGYLQVQSNADVATFASNLPNMTVLGVQDVPVRGLVEDRYSYAEDKGLTVDLIYASAVPVEKYGNIRSPALSRIADLTLFAQYTGSMRLAATRGPCDLYLMVLGGGVFENKRPNIRAAIIGAYTLMKDELLAKKVTVRVLTYKRDETGEHTFFDT